MRLKILYFLLTLSSAGLILTAGNKLPDPSWNKLPRWRGFNLLEKYHRDWCNHPFNEADFKEISELGFNFVRLPLDYRIWIKDNDWNKINEEELKEIDRAIEYGKKYNIHVCLNFHRAPGYTVNTPKEPKSLWTDPEALEACAKHWAMFAKRYKGIPNRNLSFNLLNEPAKVSAKKHAKVIETLVKAIRQEDPDRLIIIDGRNWGMTPCPELIKLKVAQATRGYQPFNLTHYKASWVECTDSLPVPVWPVVQIPTFLYGPWKKNFARPLRIRGDFGSGWKLRFRVGIVSYRSKLIVKADGKEIFSKVFIPGAGKGEWKESIYKPQWKIYQNVYNKDYTVDIPPGTKELEIDNLDGDWLSLPSLGLRKNGGKEYVIRSNPNSWSIKMPKKLEFHPENHEHPFNGEVLVSRDILWKKYIEPWKKLEKQGVGVMVGEFGAYNKTPHDVTLRWLKDVLKNYQKAGWGWALWNFKGDFGPYDSRRKDVKYVNSGESKLDVEMLRILQKY